MHGWPNFGNLFMEISRVLHHTSMKHLLIIALLAVGVAVFAQDDFEVIEILEPYDRDICIWPHSGFEEITFRAAIVSSSGSGGLCAIPERILDLGYGKKNQKRERQIDWSLLENNMIESRKEFRALIGHLDLEVDWKTEKLSFYTTSSTYKFGALDSDYVLMGIALSEDGKTLCLGYLSTFHGVCQGICQQPEWFSHTSSSYAIVIPNTVEHITSTSCYFGPDCSEVP